MIFHDRREAGRALARAMGTLPELADAIVLALPRGGVPVAFEVARALGLPLDIFLVRKLGVPGEEELAMGAVASGGIVVLNNPVIRAYAIRREVIDDVVAREQLEIQRRSGEYRGAQAPIPVEGRTAIVIDDGLATGSTMKAAVLALRPLARRVIVGVPVGAAGTCEAVRGEVDHLVCLESPQSFSAVGEFYQNFDPTGDEEVRALLHEAWPGGGSSHGA